MSVGIYFHESGNLIIQCRCLVLSTADVYYNVQYCTVAIEQADWFIYMSTSQNGQSV